MNQDGTPAFRSSLNCAEVNDLLNKDWVVEPVCIHNFQDKLFKTL